MTDAIHATITGHVQGVGFRAWTKRTARDLGLTGWVRNREDGSVEAVFQGDCDSLNKMRDALHRGPSLSRVEGVTVRDTDQSAGVDFEIR